MGQGNNCQLQITSRRLVHHLENCENDSRRHSIPPFPIKTNFVALFPITLFISYFKAKELPRWYLNLWNTCQSCSRIERQWGRNSCSWNRALVRLEMLRLIVNSTAHQNKVFTQKFSQNYSLVTVQTRVVRTVNSLTNC
jgi:hypothetical protein